MTLKEDIDADPVVPYQMVDTSQHNNRNNT